MAIEGSTLGLLAYMLKPMFDQVFVGGDTGAMWWVGGVIFALFLFRAISSVVQRVILTQIAQTSSAEMQTDLVAHLMKLDSQFFHENPPGALMERIQGDTVALQSVWRILISGVGRDSVSLISLMAVAIAIDPVWTLVALCAVPLLVAPAAMLQRYIRRKTNQMREIASQRSTRLDEIFHGINPIKLNRMEDYQLGRFQALVARIVGAEVKMAAGQTAIPALIDVITGIGFVAVLFFGGREIISGDKTIGDFMSFFTAMTLAFEPIRRLGGMAGAWQTAAASLARLFWLFDQSPTILPPARASIVPKGGDIVFDTVSLSYGDQPVLRDLSFTAKAGQTIALVGASGAGKSTVFNVLTRLVDPASGSVTLGGVGTRDLTLADLRATFSVVTQETLLFDETLRDNILLDRTDVSEARLNEALEAAHVTPFLANLPAGLDSPAGPRGANLSGGQRQRVAIARALLQDAPVLLLDEATSALDSAAEKAVQGALDRLSEGRTTLVIAHRLATVRDADKIVVLDQGQVVEEGTHAELLRKKGAYARLHALQFAEDA